MRKLGQVVSLCCLCALLVVGFGVARRALGQGRRGRRGRGAAAAQMAAPALAGPVRLAPDAIAVRIMLGRQDTAATAWDGSLTVTDGTLLGVTGWRFRQQDAMTGPSSWRAMTRRQQRRAGQGANAVSPIAANGIIATLKA